MTIIVLEGPDLAGKTTVAQWLQAELIKRHLFSTYIKRGPIRDDPMIEYLHPLNAAANEPQDVLVLDRWHVGELIYGPMLRGRSELTGQQAAYIEMVLQSLSCVFVHITAPIPVLQDRWDMRGDSLIKREWLKSISDLYWDYVSMRHHWVSMTASAAYDFPALYARRTPMSPLPGWYIGPPNPAVLLLGDERNSPEFTWPFVPRRATSGHWLMGALHAGAVNHMRVGLLNACERTTDQLHRLWNVLGCPPVVTLGRNAERAWRMADPGQRASQTYLHHPQYQRRFHYQSFAEYGEQIKKAMR